LKDNEITQALDVQYSRVETVRFDSIPYLTLLCMEWFNHWLSPAGGASGLTSSQRCGMWRFIVILKMEQLPSFYLARLREENKGGQLLLKFRSLGKMQASMNDDLPPGWRLRRPVEHGSDVRGSSAQFWSSCHQQEPQCVVIKKPTSMVSG
jgi:hypothetical protein